MPEDNREIKYGAAIREAIDLCMNKYSNVYVIGLGVPDPKGVFGTTVNLAEKYGKERVLDMPLSENAMAGVCIGSALVGMRPIMSHQRMDFSLLLLDQVVNNASKWYYMFGGQKNVPFVIRVIVGRGWGQGPHHSQSLQALYAHIPGLKVVMPTTPYDAKGLLISSVEDNNPVIFIEDRWLYNISGYVPKKMYRVPISKAKIVRKGEDITIAATSYMTIESIKASNVLEKIGVDAEIIDIRTIKPLDNRRIVESVEKTGRLLVVDSGWKTGGIASEVIAGVVEKSCTKLKCAPQRLTLPDAPTPSSRGLSKYYYPLSVDIVKKSLIMTGLDQNKKEIKEVLKSLKSDIPLDVPDLSFTGPF
jgi:pyruvate dehydrogenase E1 component beta subunit